MEFGAEDKRHAVNRVIREIGRYGEDPVLPDPSGFSAEKNQGAGREIKGVDCFFFPHLKFSRSKKGKNGADIPIGGGIYMEGEFGGALVFYCIGVHREIPVKFPLPLLERSYLGELDHAGDQFRIDIVWNVVVANEIGEFMSVCSVAFEVLSANLLRGIRKSD
jgi:hypothetical protein